MLSLQEPPERPAPSVSRAEAVIASAAVHLVAAFLLLYVPRHIPDGMRAWLVPRAIAAQPVPAPAAPSSGQEVAKKQEPRDSIPLEFTYVKIPDDTPVAENPDARLLSDRNRRARQETRPPPDASLLTPDPHSVGQTRDRVRPDPELPEGQDTPVPPREEPGGATDAPGPGAEVAAAAGPREGVGRESEGVAPREGAGTGREGTMAGGAGGREGAGGGESGEGEGRRRIDEALSDYRPGEFKFTFNNPGFLRGEAEGSLSFDTQEFPWGDYARQIYVIVRNNWLARYPLAAREGIRGYVCWHIRIARDGRLGEFRRLRSSSVPPLDRAAADALRASDPLPPLPENFPHDSEGVAFCFYYNMIPGEAE
ncbi:MAG: TonB family protein [Candidatus Polarisedimenticolia bacterium]